MRLKKEEGERESQRERLSERKILRESWEAMGSITQDLAFAIQGNEINGNAFLGHVREELLSHRKEIPTKEENHNEK